jgi:hypothetical protein
MGFRVLSRTADQLRLIAPSDDAVDAVQLRAWLEAIERQEKAPADPEPADVQAARKRLAAYRAYCRGEAHDLNAVPLTAGIAPAYLIVRPLNPRERAIAGYDGSGNVGALAYDLVRLGLVKVEGLDGWKEQRESYHGLDVLTYECVSQLPQTVVEFAANHIYDLSALRPLP